MNRRELLALAGAAAASSALPAAARASTVGRADPAAYALFDPAIPASRRFANAAGHAVEISDDLVRQWRDGLGAACGQTSPVSALVRWSDAMVLAGLLKESRRGASIDRVASEDGGSLFLLRA